tara:strand:+ start:234 stop:383 length:150 start_codon:yes stop_codon:yes gene_type:complete
VKVGDLVKYMSRTVLVVEIGEDWVWGLELGETTVAKYRRHVLKVINETR